MIGSYPSSGMSTTVSTPRVKVRRSTLKCTHRTTDVFKYGTDTAQSIETLGSHVVNLFAKPLKGKESVQANDGEKGAGNKRYGTENKRREREREEWADLLVSGTSTLSGGPCGIYACIPIALTRLLSYESPKFRITCQVRGCALYSALERTYALVHTLN